MIVFVVAQDMAAATKIARSRNLKNSDWTFVRSAGTFVKVMGEEPPSEVVVLIQRGWSDKRFTSEQMLRGEAKPHIIHTHPIAQLVDSLQEQGAEVVLCS